MNDDLTPLLQRWPFVANPIQARFIQGLDGTPKVQLRTDLGILQMELEGRPDGDTPGGNESLLDHYENIRKRLEEEGQEKSFRLTQDDCIKLQQEASQYYHRYLALFNLGDYPRVIHDTEHNLRILNFVTKHAEQIQWAAVFQQFRAFIFMTMTRAKGMLAIQQNDFRLAIKHIEWGIEQIQNFLKEHYPPEVLEHSQEILFLQNWLKEIKEKRPLTPKEKLQRQLNDAIVKEDYEKAARLRDALKELS